MTKYEKALKVLVSDIGFEPEGDNLESYDRLGYMVFRKSEDNGDIHEVVIEDHRRDEDVGDWLIFSYFVNDDTNWIGQTIDTPCPLTLNEYEAFKEFIKWI